MKEIRCDGEIPVVDMAWEARVVTGQIKECREKLASLEAKERRIQRWLGQNTCSEFMQTKVFDIKGVD